MASTFSTTLRLELIGDGDQSGIWGQTTNTNLGTLLEQAITGVVNITMTNANYTLTNFNGVSDESRNAVLVVGGTNAAVRDIITPLVEKLYVVKNSTVGGFAINIRAATGSSVSVPSGATVWVYCDGTNFNAIGTESVGNFEVNGNLTVTGNTNAVAATYTGNVAALNYSTAGNVAATGNVSAANFTGAGLTITSINASNISAGTIANVRTTAASANGASTIVARDSNGSFSANVGTFTTVSGDASAISNINASNISSGTVASARIAGSYTGITGVGTVTAGTWNATTIAVANGGTGVTSSTGTGSTVLSASPTFTGTPLAPTAIAGTNTTQIATTAFVLANGIPSGSIILWSGSIASIPSGWLLCNGSSGTPDLRDRFVVGAGSTYAVNATGGSANAVVVAHTHTATSSSAVTDPGHDHEIFPKLAGNFAGSGNVIQGATSFGGYGSSSTGTKTTGITVATTTTVDSSGVSATNANLPPYFALAYIMKA
jgi:hypothetical protein